MILTNPPFGGKEGKDAQKNLPFETSATQVLFVQDILTELARKGTCAIVLDEGLLFVWRSDSVHVLVLAAGHRHTADRNDDFVGL